MNVGDKAWFVAGYSGEYLIAIQVQLLEEDADATGWWVDEPVGHSLTLDDLFDTRQEAETELRRRVGQITKLEPGDEVVPTLEGWREDKKEFIRMTWAEEGGEAHIDVPEYPNKVEGVDWFNSLSGR